MTNKKMTNKMALTYVLEKCEIPVDVKEKLEKMIESLDKKSASNGERKLTQTQKENIVYLDILLNFLSTTNGKTVTECIKEIPELNDFSNQKVSALMKKLVDSGKVEKRIEKNHSVFYKITE